MTLPLSGVRVIEFTHVWAGPLCGQLLADAGADVVKLESRGHIDVHRRAGPYSGGRQDIDSSGVWNAQNRGKRSVSLNLKCPEGVRLAVELIAKADVVIDNFRPGVLRKLGLDFEAMRAVNPGIVGVSISGFGLNESWRNYPAYGPTMDAVAGLAVATSDEHGRPQAVNGWLPDVSASLYAVTAIANGLELARQTGKGCWYDVDELNSTLGLIPEQSAVEADDVHAASCMDVRSNRFSNADLCYVCACKGDDEWVAMRIPPAPEGAETVLTILLSRFESCESSEVSSMDSIAKIVSQLTKEQVASVLQEEGVEAVPVNAAADLMANEDLLERGSYVDQRLANGDTLRSYSSVIRWGDIDRAGRSAPAFGNDTEEVLIEWLGLTVDQFQELKHQDKLFW